MSLTEYGQISHIGGRPRVNKIVQEKKTPQAIYYLYKFCQSSSVRVAGLYLYFKLEISNQIRKWAQT